MQAPNLPEVTDAHRRAAFAAMRWNGWTFEAAMADETRQRVIEARAHQLRTQEWKATHSRSTTLVRRFNPQQGRWVTQRAPGPWTDQPELENLT